MSNVSELIERAEAALKDLPPTPWEAHEWNIDDANGYEVIADMSGVSDEVRDLIEEAPVLIQELMDALKEAETNLDNALMREQRTVEEMESWMDQAIKHEEWAQYYEKEYRALKSLNGRDPRDPR